MGLWRSEETPPNRALPAEELRDLLTRSAELREHVLLATPYLSFPCRLIDAGPKELHLSTMLTRDTAKRTLEGQSLRLRMPWKLTMVAGPVVFKEHKQWDRRRELVIGLPPWMAPDDQRRYPRCMLVGKSFFTLTREDLQQVRGQVESVSEGGVGIFIPPSESAHHLQMGMVIELGLRLEGGLELKTKARLVNGEAPCFGLAFAEGLPKSDLEKLQTWLKPRLQEAQRRWDNQHVVANSAAAPPAAPLPASTPTPRGTHPLPGVVDVNPMLPQAEGVLIMGGQLFSEEVISALEGLGPFRSAPAALAALKPLVDPPPVLAIMQVVNGNLEERYRLRELWNALGLECPLILLGTGSPGCAQELGQELRAGGALQWNPKRSRFFQRMAQGLAQKARGE